jgi:RNA polymerase sigma-32 factor
MPRRKTTGTADPTKKRPKAAPRGRAKAAKPAELERNPSEAFGPATPSTAATGGRAPVDPEVLPPEDGSADLQIEELGEEGAAETEAAEPDEDEDSGPEGPVLDVGSAPSLPVRRAESGPSATALEHFLREMGRYPLLTPDEEHELTARVYAGHDPIAARKLVIHNLRLVVKMAYCYRRAWTNILDLIQEGNVGLVEAVRRFDPFKGARFSTYASFWIRAYMIRYLLDHSRMVRISRTRAGRKLFFRLSKERESLRALGVEPGPKLLADRLGVSQEDFEEVVRHMDQPEIRLDAPISHDGESGDTVLDTLSSADESPEAQAHRFELSQDVQEAFDAFAKTLEDPRELAAWNEHLMSDDPLPLSELGTRFGVTKQRMGQIVMSIRKRLKEHLVKTLGPDVQLDYSMELE